MGKIKKTPSERHNATVSPGIAQYVNDVTSVPLHQLPAKLAEFPIHWPYPRGDLYHWISLLDRFDHILEIFNKEYGLDIGPQTKSFSRRLLEKGDAEDGSPTSSTPQKQELDAIGFSEEGDKELIEDILQFTRILLERCGNRSLYASSGHINDLLHTTSLDLLQACLQLSLRLAHRYQTARLKNNHPQAQAVLLANHYNINLENIHKIALPFPKPSSAPQHTQATPSKSHDKTPPASTFNPNDLVAIAKDELPTTIRSELSSVGVTIVEQNQIPAKPTTSHVAVDGTPASPTPTRRNTSNLSLTHERPSAVERSASADDLTVSPVRSREAEAPSNTPQVYRIPTGTVFETPAHTLVSEALAHIPKESQYDLLHRVRIAKAFASSNDSVKKLLNVRLLAVANLAFALSESKFQEKLGNRDMEEPRRFHLPQQLCDLLQPIANGQKLLSLDMETTVLETLEAIGRCKQRSSEVVDSLAVSVNHGILYYELRQAIASLHANPPQDRAEELHQLQWRNAVFDLVSTVSQVNHHHVRYAEKMVAAGVIEILLEALTLRTPSAERVYEKIIGFLSSFIHGVSTAFQVLANARGLEIITDLASSQISLAMDKVSKGEGMPEDSKSKVVDYDIPYYQQATLRSLFKFVVYLFDHNSGVHDRLLRNLLDSAQMLAALRTVIDNAKTFGSNVWDAAINTVSNFIHNEPTSFQVIAEAGLAKAILEAVTQQSLPDDIDAISATKAKQAHNECDDFEVVDGKIQFPDVPGILPVSETICDIPTAFGALCLNEQGMKLFQASDALNTYLRIFVSPNHVRALEEEGQTAFSIGNAFDELSRHHPQLKEQILDAVTRTVKRVRSLTKLMSERQQALPLLEDGAKPGEVPEASDRAPAVPYISACFKFLEGFFHNSSMCQGFCRAGGADVVLDIITSGAINHDLSAFPGNSKIGTVIHRMCEEKPHLVLPSLLARAKTAVTTLKSFADPSTSSSKLATLFDFDNPGSAKDLGFDVSAAVDSLASACTLCSILGRIFSVPSFGARNNHSNQLFANLNATDIYIQLIDDLSNLYSACVWEGIAIQQKLPEKWKAQTDPLLFGRDDAKGVLEDPNDQVPGGNVSAFTFTAGTLRYLFDRLPAQIESFFQSLGQALTPKRTSDGQQKQYAALVADRLAHAAINELTSRRLTETDRTTRYKYVNIVLNATTRMFLRHATSMEVFGTKEAVTLVLLKFFQAGGFDELGRCLQDFTNALAQMESDDDPIARIARDGLNIILSFYAQITKPKCITEAMQSSMILMRGPENADYFMPGQFLLELRHTVLRSVVHLWRVDAITRLGADNVKTAINILCEVLKAEGEERALKRSDNATKRVPASKPDFKLRNTSNLEKLESAGFEKPLAIEAIYRCNNHEANATEYCELRVNHNGPRFPAPDTESDSTPLAPPTHRRVSLEMVDAHNESEGSANQASSNEAPDADQSVSDDEDFGTLGALPEDLVQQDIAEMVAPQFHPMLMPGAMPPSSTPTKDTKMPYITVDDLDEERDNLREDLIDRCLDVLSALPDLTWQLAELIQAAVAKTGEGANPRADIGKTLVSSLLSLQGEEASAQTGEKVKAYAHLVALILQDRDFFDSTLDELKDYFDSLVAWIRLQPDQSAENAPWIKMLLLIMERVLAEDEQPVEVEWTPPPAENPLKPLPTPTFPEAVVSEELRLELLDALVDILPKIGKDDSLALSVSRVLVTLTRRRSLAKRLSDRHSMSRLFLMVRQLASPIGDRLQSSFLLILRHMIEDEQTVRQIMRTQIKTAFDNLQSRSRGTMETNAYVKIMYHLVIRDPQVFVETTQEMLEITGYNGQPLRGQTLMLKKSVEASEKDQSESSNHINTADGTTDQAKATETKPPQVESTDGVIQFLLRELSNYKEVEDRPPQNRAPSQSIPSAGTLTTGDGDVDMEASTPMSSTPLEGRKNEKPVFKADEHGIYIYRCFIMQCLSELLACYTRTKVEFINFSRKSEPQPATPSKPRSGTINYLLNNLLPVGSLEHKDDTAHRKKVNSSDWATNLLVALCSRTHERPYERQAGRDVISSGEDQDLLFVRRFVLEHALRSFKEAVASTEPLDLRYSRLLALADLFERLLSSKQDRTSPINTATNEGSQLQLGRLMYERNFIAALTSSIAEVDLSFPNAKRAVKHILVPLKMLTDLAVELSQRGELSSSGPSTSAEEDEISSATSVSDDSEGEEREQTPDLFRNSTLSMFEASGSHDDESDTQDEDDDDEEMYDGGYDEEREYEDDNGETISDDEDIEGIEVMEGMDEMGDIEGLPGDMAMEVEIIGDDDDEDDPDDDEDDDEDDEDDDDDDLDEGDDDQDYLQDLEEVTGDDGDASLGDDMEEIDWNSGEGLVPVLHDTDLTHGGPLDHLARVIGADDRSDTGEQEGVVGIDMGAGDADFFEDEMPPEDDDEEDEEGDYDGDVVYEPELEEDEDGDTPWGFEFGPPPGAFLHPRMHHHHHFRRSGLEEIIGRVGDTLRPSRAMRFHGGVSHNRGDDSAMNPLLQRLGAGPGAGDRDRESLNNVSAILPPFRRAALGRGAEGALFQDFMQAMDRHGLPSDGLGRFTLTMDQGLPFPGLPSRHQPHFIDIDPHRSWREQAGFPLDIAGRDTRGAANDEAQAVEFKPALTILRWQEEARVLFGDKYHEKALRALNSLLRLLVPPAMETKRIKDKEEAERKAAEERAREEERKKAEAEKAEREAKDKREREEREAREAEEAAARAREEAEAGGQAEPDGTLMEGIEATQPAPAEGHAETTQETPQVDRVFITIRGREVDITNLGIDRGYLDALPEEFREEVIMSQITEQRSQAQQTGGPPEEISREFLEALPPDLQQELRRQENIDRRRREQRESTRRNAETGNAQPVGPQEVDPVDFLAMLDPPLRQQILMDAHDNPTYLGSLPEEIQREAHALLGERRPPTGLVGRFADNNRARMINVDGREARGDDTADRTRIRPVVQMLDKAGVATLLRLMFVSLHHKAKSSLHGILSHVCKNSQNRAEVISILLSILQDGTADVSAVERSFAQLSLRAKQLSSQKTPQPLKRTLTGQMAMPVSELSPMHIVLHCLSTLNALSNDNPKVQTFFLSEHETVTSQKNKVVKKGKMKESKAAKYPLNALLTLLDRKLITENTGVMETLAALLSRVTLPLQILLKKAKEAQDTQNKSNEDDASAQNQSQTQPQAQTEGGQGSSNVDVPMQETPTGPTSETDATGEPSASLPADTGESGNITTEQQEKKKRTQRELEPPEVSEENIRLVVNILAARECPSKTFSDTLDIIKHMSAIPGAKEVFGRELIRQAQELGASVVADLDELAKQIGSAENGTDVQGMALASFSSAGSKQRKLLRVLLALDHLFDPKRMQGQHNAIIVDPKLKEDILTTLYESDTFQNLWKTLSSCLGVIRQRGDMVNVATILLPLIESLMVVCRNSILKDAPLNATQAEVTVGTPPPETRVEGLFFNFTEEHRKILNELIRNNPKLMNGNLSILAKNSKVLEFDNKRNYFNRKLHNRGADVRVAHPALTLNVRRDQVFMDSFKSLYHKSGNEIKNGKLNIRFSGEEGIDAGGVSREWFAVMARQMFNPDFALFNPVASDRTTFHPNRLSDINPEHLLFFKFIGRVIGKALYEGRVLDCHFSRAVYRRILGKSVSLKDMETLDLDYYKSLVWILENDITDITFETFSIEVDRFGVTETVDLVTDGRNVPVTEENKQEYVRLVVEHRLIKSVEEQLDCFLKGFHDIIPAELVSIFNEQELELLISGLPEIDVDDWKNNTEYHNYQATSAQIQWFWRAVKSFDPEERAKLLQFVTGTSKVPLNGFKELEGMNGFAKFNIHRDYSSKEKLPTSHTCFNQLDLPEYESYEHLRQQLYTAITAGSEYFGFA